MSTNLRNGINADANFGNNMNIPSRISMFIDVLVACCHKHNDDKNINRNNNENNENEN